MSGTSGDGVDASLINSDGDTNYKVEINKYFEYENKLSEKFSIKPSFRYEIVNKTILQIKEGLKKREYSALEVTDAFISASESNKKLNSRIIHF